MENKNNKMEVIIVTTQSNGWSGLYINDKLVFKGDNLTNYRQALEMYNNIINNLPEETVTHKEVTLNQIGARWFPKAPETYSVLERVLCLDENGESDEIGNRFKLLDNKIDFIEAEIKQAERKSENRSRWIEDMIKERTIQMWKLRDKVEIITKVAAIYMTATTVAIIYLFLSM